VARPALRLKQGRDRSARNRHPWVFSGAVERTEGDPEPGAVVDVLDDEGGFVARGTYHPGSQIIARLFAFDPRVEIDDAFITARLRACVSRRAALHIDSNAQRVVNSEGDGLPGVIIDRYDETVVVQLLTAGAERFRDTIADAVRACLEPRVVVERSDGDVRSLEGLEPRIDVWHGERPEEPLLIREGECRYRVNVLEGHKTGFYLDQRDARAAVGRAATDADVLNLFSYTGGFGVAAVVGGARSVLNVDTSRPALELCAQNLMENGVDNPDDLVLRGDVFEVLRDLRDEGAAFDVIVLDPPKFVPSKRLLDSGLRGYKDINRLAFGLLAPGGRLFTYSCSGLVDAALFQKVVFQAAFDAQVDAAIVGRSDHAADHPVSLYHPEGRYLKGLVCQQHEV
jgi:23S rRNA (cytosine1962-C5)-methyltransferase